MSVWKKVLLLLAVFLLVLFAVCFPLRARIPSWIATLENSWYYRPYEIVASGEEGMACAARIEDGSLFLRFFDVLNPKTQTKWDAALSEEAETGELCMLYPQGDTSAFFGLYEEDAQFLSLYYVEKGGVPERIMQEACPGDSAVERRRNLAFSSVAEKQGEICFTLLTKDTVRGLSYNPTDGLKEQKELDRGGALSAVNLDGKIYRGENAEMALTFMGSGLYYLDGATLKTHYADLSAETVNQDLLDLSGYLRDHQLTSFCLTKNGSALLLLDGHTLYLVKGDGVQDLSKCLALSRSDCIIRLAGVLAVALILSIVLWWMMIGRFRSRLPLAVYWGVVSLAAVFLIGLLLCYGLLRPGEERSQQQLEMDLTDSIVDLALAEHSIGDKSLPDILCRSLEAGGESLEGLSVVPIQRKDGEWYLPVGARAAVDSGVHDEFVKMADDQEGTSYGVKDGRFWYCRTEGNQGLSISFQWDRMRWLTRFEQVFLVGMAVLAVSTLLMLTLIGRDVRKTARGLECFASDQEWHRLRVSGGDELEGMASTLNSMAAERREADRIRERFITSYRRFVPEEILNLLGKKSVLDVDQNTIASRRMAVMQISFTFPAPVYTNGANTRLMFDSVNQVIEHTASIVRQKGGVVFNFRYNGYDVVMERDPRQVISAAVAVRQEILTLNEQRAQDALPTVTLRIAMDIGGVILGIVGDQSQIEPATISDCFSTLRELIGVCGRVEANILCTESVISGAEGYGSRYMGKCLVGDRPVRVYEIFDGDPYDVRKGKEAGIHRFSEGVLSLYSGEVAQAKRIFLDLVRDTYQDGGARYYLYLSDKLTEKDAMGELSLNGRMENDDDEI